MTHSETSIIRTTVPCSCVGSCGVVTVVEFERYGDQPHEVFVEFYTSYHGRLRRRVKAAIGVLFGRDPYFHAICLHADEVERLRTALGGDK